MRRLVVAVIAWLLLAFPANGQGPIYLPLVSSENPCEQSVMSDFKIVIPETTTNMALNPSAETTTNYAALGTATVLRSSLYQHYGLYSYHVLTAADNDGISLTLSALSNAIHYVTVRVMGDPVNWDWSLDNANYTEPTLLEEIDGTWNLYGVEFPAAQANGSTTLYIRQDGAAVIDFYLDGVQVEAKEYWTTYCDGTQEGCEWLGAAHAATSQRSAGSRAGGRLRDLQTDYNLNVGGMTGTGTAPQELGLSKYAILPGGELSNIKVSSRSFTLTGVIYGSSWANFHSKKQALLEALLPDTYPEDQNGPQPVRLRYHGATVHKEIAAHYEGGLEGELVATGACYWEQVAVRFLAPDPYWYEIGESAAELDTQDSATMRIVAGRLRSTGQWDDLGPPNAAGTYTDILAIAEDGTYVYFGGNFDNFDNIANADHIVRYNKQTGAWSALGTGLNDYASALAIGPDGSLYAGGNFTTAGGGAANYVAKWDGSAWSALGAGTNGTVITLAFGLDGLLYVGGDFATAGGGAAAYIAKWNGTAWSALGTGMDDLVWSLAVGLDGTVYAGGAFATAGGGAAAYIAKWNGTAWSALGTGMDGVVFALAVGLDGTLYAGGGFSTAGGVSANQVASWNGTAWKALGAGVDSNVYDLAVGSDGILYVCGTFTSAGGIDINNHMTRWNGASWGHIDLDIVGAFTMYAILPSPYSDPIVKQKYDIWTGFTISGTATYAGKVTVSNNGTTIAYPVITITRSGGTSATLATIRNETTGKELLFDYDLQSGETLTINLEPTQKSIVSSFYGSRPDAILANSDFGTFALLPGDNNITAFVITAGGPTVTGKIQWRDQYRSQD